MGKTGIKLTNVSKSFSVDNRKIKVLDGVNLTVASGELCCIIGPNGNGKTTLVKIIAGIESQTSGHYDRPERLAYLPQQNSLLPWLTVKENIELPGRVSRLLDKDTQNRIEKYLKKYELSKFVDFYPNEISGGMQQKTALLRAVAYRPEIIILDEPFSALDAITRIEMRQMLVDLWAEYKPTILCVTHDIDEAIYLSDRIFVLSERPGKISKVLNVGKDRPRTLGYINNSSSVKLKKSLYRMLLK